MSYSSAILVHVMFFTLFCIIGVLPIIAGTLALLNYNTTEYLIEGMVLLAIGIVVTLAYISLLNYWRETSR